MRRSDPAPIRRNDCNARDTDVADCNGSGVVGTEKSFECSVIPLDNSAYAVSRVNKVRKVASLFAILNLLGWRISLAVHSPSSTVGLGSYSSHRCKLRCCDLLSREWRPVFVAYGRRRHVSTRLTPPLCITTTL